MESTRMIDPVPSKDLSSLLVDTAQLLDGWKQTSPQDWSEWDQTVRDRLSQQLALLEASKRVTATDLAKTVDAPRPVWSEALQDDIYYASDIDPYIERLRTTLTGISTCSTCEACRGAALRERDILAELRALPGGYRLLGYTAAEEIETLRQELRAAQDYAREVEDEYRKRTGHGFGDGAAQPPGADPK